MSDDAQTLGHAEALLPADLLVGEFFIEIATADGTPRRLGPFTPPLRIGSAPGNDLVVEDPTVSRFHCSLRSADGGLAVHDTDSRNGTFVGGLRVGSAWLVDGAAVRLGETRLSIRVARARPRDLSLADRFGDLLGQSRAMREIFAILERVSPRMAPVLIEGETGTGKELAARAVHARGPNPSGPFVVVDCGALAPSLVESELFGHTRGAFTGADQARTGAFGLADGGTIFLDELGELDAALQPKLLRVLESGRFKPVGSGQERAVSVRVVAATHRDLRRMVNTERFREDLYYRIAVCPVALPPLRERAGDLALLARHFLARSLFGPDAEAQRAPALSPETMRALSTRRWPGNVRELRNTIERAVILGDAAEVDAGDLRSGLAQAPPRRPGPAPTGPLDQARRQFEREYLIALLGRHGGAIGPAATEADVHPKSLARLLRRHGLPRR